MKFPPVNEQMDLIRRGVEEILPEDELVNKIQKSFETSNPLNIKLIVDQCKVPVILDAGIGSASDACFAMELGCDAVLVNSAIAKSKDPIGMAESFKSAVIAGRQCFLSGKMRKKQFATATSPTSKIFS